jgi:hypothetical protein
MLDRIRVFVDCACCEITGRGATTTSKLAAGWDIAGAGVVPWGRVPRGAEGLLVSGEMLLGDVGRSSDRTLYL